MNIVYIVLIISILLFLSSFFLFKHTHKINEGIDHKNKLLEDKNERLIKDCKKLTNEIENKHKELQSTKEEIERNKQSFIDKKDSYEVLINDRQKQLNDLQDAIKKTTETQEELSRKAFKNYVKVLEEQYTKEEKEYDKLKQTLVDSYSELQLKLMREADECRADLDKIRTSRAAAIEAQRKEKEISEQQSFYCLIISDNDMKDIAVLDSIKPKLNKPRTLSMLIWQTYFRASMNRLCNDVLGTKTKTGIYKITNQLTKECYIGQAVDVASRFKEHAKCGLGIDPPAANKLYKAMEEYGIWNFSWELLEECSRDQLNEKEKFYIELYQAQAFGYNGTKGNK